MMIDANNYNTQLNHFANSGHGPNQIEKRRNEPVRRSVYINENSFQLKSDAKKSVGL